MNSGASEPAHEPALIGIDWGTSSLRAYLLGRRGDVLDRIVSSDGILQVGRDGFEAVFDALVRQWPGIAGLPVLASGMITSRSGWVETPYLAAPLGADELARALVAYRTAGGTDLHFVTGMTSEHDVGPDVMRGEETQVIGACAQGASGGVFVLPGTHSKWVRVSGGRILDHATFMTGELFAALRGHTILGALIEPGPFDADGFARGVDAGLAQRSSLLHDLFHVRTLPLLGRLGGTAVADYLSGLLIGTEIAAGAARDPRADDTNGGHPRPVTLVGRSDLADRYEIAFGRAGLPTRRAPEDIVATGHFTIARAAGLVPR